MHRQKDRNSIEQIYCSDKPIPIFMEKSVETIGAFRGAVYAGCFYVLIDTETAGQPSESDSGYPEK